MLSLPRAAAAERWLLRRILSATGYASIRMVLANGEGISPPGVDPAGTIAIRDHRTLLRMVLHPEVGFGDGYADGKIKIDGDLVGMLEAVYRSWPSVANPSPSNGRAARWMERLRANTPQRSRRNVYHHYDLKTDFYQLWLDPDLLYTCAYFPTPTATLEEAQIAKMDHVCRKLQLQSGETVVEAGCGWGSLALHMARNYGVRVKAFNLSHEQTVFARQRARQEGLADRVEFVEDDYRNISGRYDVFVSVGMLEHVGASHYAQMGKVIHRTIGSHGRGLLHFIGRNYPAPLSAWIRKHIFPGAYSPTLREAMEILEPWDFAVCDVENLRLHYARTLEHWLQNFERHAEQISAMYDARFVRMWRLYLAGSLVAFRVGTMQLFQIIFAGSHCRQIPWTREHLYATGQPDAQKPTWTHVMS